MTLREANLTNKYRVIVLTTIKATKKMEDGKQKFETCPYLAPPTTGESSYISRQTSQHATN